MNVGRQTNQVSPESKRLQREKYMEVRSIRYLVESCDLLSNKLCPKNVADVIEQSNCC